MSRIRTIKPGFFTSLSLAECSIPARLTFAGLWCEADDYGRGKADLRLLKAALWALDDDITTEVIHSHLVELEREHITLYKVDGRQYFQVVDWEKHQAAGYRRGEALYPEPPARQKCKKMRDARLNVQKSAGKDRIGKEGIGASAAHSTRFDEFWEAYPRKASKGGARTAFSKALTREDAEAIIAGATRYRDDPNRDPAFTKLPTTWLNQGCWEDEPLPSRSRGSPAHLEPTRPVLPAEPERGPDWSQDEKAAERNRERLKQLLTQSPVVRHTPERESVESA